jgi:hypothetical protein
VSTGRSIHAVPNITPSPRDGIGVGPGLPVRTRSNRAGRHAVLGSSGSGRAAAPQVLGLRLLASRVPPRIGRFRQATRLVWMRRGDFSLRSSIPARNSKFRFPPRRPRSRSGNDCLAQIAAIRRRRGEWVKSDPLLPFKIGPANGRKARKNGLRLKALVAWSRSVARWL